VYWDTRYRHFSGSTSEPILYRVIFIGIEVGLARGESNMTYGSKAVANLLIDVAKGHGQKLDQMKLQKLVYISHGWNLAISGNPLISDQMSNNQHAGARQPPPRRLAASRPLAEPSHTTTAAPSRSAPLHEPVACARAVRPACG